MDRAEHPSTDRVRKEEWRMEVADISPSGFGTICVQPGYQWYCFKGNLGETAKKTGWSANGPF